MSVSVKLVPPEPARPMVVLEMDMETAEDVCLLLGSVIGWSPARKRMNEAYRALRNANVPIGTGFKGTVSTVEP